MLDVRADPCQPRCSDPSPPAVPSLHLAISQRGSALAAPPFLFSKSLISFNWPGPRALAGSRDDAILINQAPRPSAPTLWTISGIEKDEHDGLLRVVCGKTLREGQSKLTVPLPTVTKPNPSEDCCRVAQQGWVLARLGNSNNHRHQTTRTRPSPRYSPATPYKHQTYSSGGRHELDAWPCSSTRAPVSTAMNIPIEPPRQLASNAPGATHYCGPRSARR